MHEVMGYNKRIGGDLDTYDTLLLRSWHFYCAVCNLATIVGG